MEINDKTMDKLLDALCAQSEEIAALKKKVADLEEDRAILKSEIRYRDWDGTQPETRPAC